MAWRLRAVTAALSRGARLGSHPGWSHPQGGSQQSLTPFLGKYETPSGFCDAQMYMQARHPHTKNKNKSFFFKMMHEKRI